MSLISRIVTTGTLVVLFAGAIPMFDPPAAAQAGRKSAPAKPQVAHAVIPVAPARAINGEQLQALLKRDGNRPLLVNYWATWCDPCRDEFPDLVKIDEDYRVKGLDFIAITLDEVSDIDTEVPKFLRAMKATMPVYLLNVTDPEPVINAIDPNWGGAMPATFLYNSKGEVIYKTFGRLKIGELRAAIDKTLSNK
jgi:thiol-disulfide isomerase/thioredoxin